MRYIRMLALGILLVTALSAAGCRKSNSTAIDPKNHSHRVGEMHDELKPRR